MRVIAGSAKGIHLSSVKGNTTRPIPDRIKGSLFNILADVIPDSQVIDLYAGTGAIGIEALSRGAKSCIFVENDRSAIQIIKKNLELTKLQADARVLPYDVFEIDPYLEKDNVVVDVIFASPPYPLLEKKIILGWSPGSIFLFLHQTHSPPGRSYHISTQKNGFCGDAQSPCYRTIRLENVW
ncbi:MAG: 16S rRNA (guanine(966)-N(2))-methyltransferase RsmD [Candidatus Brocadia carolinensis]|uniref:16S rRNA (Guanine(966)-N(2))-methyltransferase RsmD n=1 Tax=Candidatus Brocadia carolinensis TaxID=1004156 RepID=A0A1V4AP34_9BACT|nr:MAG: 16S rRNA (guanine(966)-N(2))-methyltransferase RsmD [Candidatus Brocadia caroliniensis]